jgi:two-component sensor histidine kinase
MRPGLTWLIFGCCAFLLFGALGWLTVHTLRLESDRRDVAATSDLEGRVRLALWRIESAALSILVRENARPPEHFDAFHSTPEAFSASYQSLNEGTVLIPSPLLTESPDEVVLFFQCPGEGPCTSPQVPVGAERRIAEQLYTSGPTIDAAQARLESAGSWMSKTRLPALQAKRPAGRLVIEQQAALVQAQEKAQVSQAAQPQWSLDNFNELVQRARNVESNTAAPTARGKFAPQKSGTRNDAVAQQVETLQEPARQSADRAQAPAGLPAAPTPPQRATLPPDEAGSFRALWLDSELVLLRAALLDGQPVTQGVWLDWPKLRGRWLGEIEDLFPDASLEPVGESSLPGDRHLASFPVKIEPGAAAVKPVAFWSPMRRTLGIAWAGVILSALAVGILLNGAISLGERRASFVSAVTHELRTPLSTFRLYAEMLKDDMVTDPANRREYLETLDREAGRLQHLVENVLAYAKLERGSARRHVERLPLNELVERVRPRLEQRAAQAGAELRVAAPAQSPSIDVDVGAVEQILFNLVDNACKYAVPRAATPVIEVACAHTGSGATVRVCDNGPGIDAAHARRLFRPFHKSANDAAHSAPGVGLGLALCRRLSRALGGDLRFERLPRGGACFVLELPLALQTTA